MKLAMLALCVLASCSSAPAPASPPITNATPKRAERLAVAIVINTQEVWMGNDQIEPERDDRGAPNPAYYPGVLSGIHAALAKRSLAEVAPGALGAVVGYHAGAKLRAPMGPIAELDEKAFGVQRDHYQTIGSDLVQGVDRAISELEHVQAERKLLLVVGDGNDTNNDTAKPRLQALRDRLAKSRIRARAIVWTGPLSMEGFIIDRLTDEVSVVEEANSVGPALVEAIERAAR